MKTDKQNEYVRKYRAKKPHMNNYCSKKNYWKAWFEEDYIKSLYDKYGDKAFDILKLQKKEEKQKIKEQQRKDANKLLMNSLKSISVN
jgi:hypothetical protein